MLNESDQSESNNLCRQNFEIYLNENNAYCMLLQTNLMFQIRFSHPNSKLRQPIPQSRQM